VVTCGTCREALSKMEAGKVFGCGIVDLLAFAASRGLALAPDGSEALYHAPCHDSLDGKGPQVIGRALGLPAEGVPHCCSEAGTLALSRPDIAEAMRHRKREALAEARRERPAATTILTNCPSCMTGLRRSADLGARAEHVAVEAARRLSGEEWREAFRGRAGSAAVVRF
jgi:Fe-S oxidoreductase